MRPLFTVIIVSLMAAPAFANGLDVKMYKALPTGQGQELGTIQISKTDGGLKFTPHLKGLPTGDHGFHVHENASCAPGQQDGKPVPALAAGGHYDPGHTGHHMGPYGNGHLGDLPVLKVNERGGATESVIAPHLKSLNEVKNHALMIHVGGDNYSDNPKPLGGGGARFACGVIK
ncbi:superoxide dismutase family protein [Brucella oryzae]|uniref:Superoxide dismutase [Cu-Zn] n=1 Tax=Brucella oryzae TaxID=335286 RepID=A0A2S7J2A6_9HYPH|nr:superoxide dismutase family protein [Brucella oryzae]PQA74379.1 superoxide dismutase [Cu-Zn] SodC2 [Brucella oryzae]